METSKVTSSQAPITVEVFPTKDCFMRKNIERIEDEDGVHFEYDEVYFISDATAEEIESNFDYYWEKGRVWTDEEITWQDRMEAQITYTALKTGTLI